MPLPGRSSMDALQSTIDPRLTPLETDLIEVIRGTRKGPVTLTALANLIGVSAEALAALGVPVTVHKQYDAAGIASLGLTADTFLVASGVGKYYSTIRFSELFRHNGGPAQSLAGPFLPFYGDPTDGMYATSNTSLLASIHATDDVHAECSGQVETNDELPFFENKPLVMFVEGSTEPVGICGAIGTATVNYGGTGFAPGDTFNVPGGLLDPVLAEGVVDAVDEDGAITAFHFTNNVNGYLLAVAVPIVATSGGGVDAVIDITELDYSVNPATLDVWMTYVVREWE